MNKNNRNDKVARIAAFILLFMFTSMLVSLMYDISHVLSLEPTRVDYTAFMQDAKDGKIFSAYTTASGTQILFQYKSDIPPELLSEDPLKFSASLLNKDKWYYINYAEYDEFNHEMLECNIPVIDNQFNLKSVQMLNTLLDIVSIVAIFLLLFLLYLLIMQQNKMGDNKYEISKNTGYKFSDVIGHDEVIADIKSYVSLLTMTKKLSEIHIKPPKGILFTGAPGTGKTLMAKAMAGEASVPFIYLNTSNVIEMYVGLGAKTIRACFKKARQLAPCVVFLDEIDAIGRTRGKAHSTSEDNQTLLALLQELDGFAETKGILVIAATNDPDSLDPALKRSGRFDREIAINPPRNRAVRKQLLEHYTKDFQLDPNFNLDDFAATLSGMTGADIANICNEAAIVAVMRTGSSISTAEIEAVATPVITDTATISGISTAPVKDIPEKSASNSKSKGSEVTQLAKEAVAATNKGIILTQDDFIVAMDKLMLKGNRLNDKSRILDIDRQIVAYHEAGHAVCSFLLGEPISRISIQGTTSGVGGFVLHEDKESQFRTRQDLFNQVMVAYAGRCSEKIHFGDDKATTGASNDIQQATKILSNMILSYGFDEELGMLEYGALSNAGLVDKTKICAKIMALSTKLENDTTMLLKQHYDLVEKLVASLLENETLTGTEAEALLKS